MSFGNEDFEMGQFFSGGNIIDRKSYLNVPEPFPGPRFREYLRVVTIFELEDFLCIPFKLLNELRINEMVGYPVPQRTAPGLV